LLINFCGCSMTNWSSPDVVRAALEADEQVQVGLRAALEFVTSKKIPEYEKCMQKVVAGIEDEKFALKDNNYFSDKKIIDLIESDVQWKEIMLRDLPIGATADQIKAILTLVKSRPFLRSLEKLENN